MMFAGFLWALTSASSSTGYDVFAAASDWVVLAGVLVSLAGIFVDRILDGEVHLSPRGAIVAAVAGLLLPVAVILAVFGG